MLQVNWFFPEVLIRMYILICLSWEHFPVIIMKQEQEQHYMVALQWSLISFYKNRVTHFMPHWKNGKEEAIITVSAIIVFTWLSLILMTTLKKRSKILSKKKGSVPSKHSWRIKAH